MADEMDSERRTPIPEAAGTRAMWCFERDTWLMAEEWAHPEGSLSDSRRRAMAVCQDGERREIVVGFPDTPFTIPGRVVIDDVVIDGFVSIENDTLIFTSSL